MYHRHWVIQHVDPYICYVNLVKKNSPFWKCIYFSWFILLLQNGIPHSTTKWCRDDNSTNYFCSINKLLTRASSIKWYLALDNFFSLPKSITQTILSIERFLLQSVGYLTTLKSLLYHWMTEKKSGRASKSLLGSCQLWVTDTSAQLLLLLLVYFLPSVC